MAFDGLVMAAVREELNRIVIGGRIEKIYQPLAREILLVIHKDRTKYRLLISADAGKARIHVTKTVRENPLTPPLFCMVLRKHLEGGKIFGVEQPGLERILKIRVEAADELGILAEKTLICEVMGKHSNIILVNPSSNTILDGINRYSYATSRHREILPGRQYVSPPESEKQDPSIVTEDLFRSKLWNPSQDLSVEKILLNSFDGLSPQTCREIAARAGLEPDTGCQFLGELELNRLWSSFETIREQLRSGVFQPVVCYSDGAPAAFSAISLTHIPEACCKQGGISEVIDEFYSVKERREQFRQEAANLLKTLKNEIKKTGKKHSIHTLNLKKAADAEQLKIFGELITANLFQIPERTDTVELENYYDPEGKTVLIPLNPRFSTAENAQLYFKKYTKARQAGVIARNYLQETEAELDYLESVVTAAEQAENMTELKEIRAELIKEGYIKPEKPGPRGPKKQEAQASKPEPMKIKTEEGFEILVGRNNRQNDYLTMKLAQPDDLWLHVKDIPGSHIVVRSPQTAGVPDNVIERAAEVAAYYSRGRESSKVPVDYTLRKNVRKPKGAKPGMVIYDSQKTVFVEPKP
ncbi:Rqc2 family fibronectin-binding protein [Phosphitispora fastidiosa]|uniref:Rqc2 family fibronectin-binding protein n=1 Tax=Phosphitispora fastidiosa TaxID=2837202 RepID=UPI001E3BEAB1|nr:NFACT RNA binding domain-containing protein [Phosphitispora fastidiosa]MBU7008459.1 putative ribosome quality control (RQC) complex YloA/Tae2 family protein [Phosphitispora fastidiosa]